MSIAELYCCTSLTAKLAKAAVKLYYNTNYFGQSSTYYELIEFQLARSISTQIHLRISLILLYENICVCM